MTDQHPPALHHHPASHLLPQAPQLSLSVLVSTHELLQVFGAERGQAVGVGGAGGDGRTEDVGVTVGDIGGVEGEAGGFGGFDGWRDELGRFVEDGSGGCDGVVDACGDDDKGVVLESTLAFGGSGCLELVPIVGAAELVWIGEQLPKKPVVDPTNTSPGGQAPLSSIHLSNLEL